MITGSGKVKRPNIGPAVWRHQKRDALNEAHFDFFLAFFFFAITLLLAFDARVAHPVAPDYAGRGSRAVQGH
jgi:hypothetical protein